MFEFKECLGFKFVKAGEFYLAQTPWCGTFNKKLFKQWNYNGRKTTQPVFVLKNI